MQYITEESLARFHLLAKRLLKSEISSISITPDSLDSQTQSLASLIVQHLSPPVLPPIIQAEALFDIGVPDGPLGIVDVTAMNEAAREIVGKQGEEEKYVVSD